MSKILLFIPTYNCEKQICRVLEKVYKNSAFFSEIIIVDNRSTDNTVNIIQTLKDEKNYTYKIFINDNNYGLGGSHKVAFNYAINNKFDYVIVLHGDDQGNINDLIPILQNTEYKKYDCVLGSRFMNGSTLNGYSKFRTLGNKIYNMIFSVLLNKKILDLGSGLNMYDVNILKSEYYYKFPDNLVFNYTMILASHFFKQNIKFFPISWSEDDQKSNVKMLSQSITVLQLLFQYKLNKQKFMKKEHRDNTINYYTYKELN